MKTKMIAIISAVVILLTIIFVQPKKVNADPVFSYGMEVHLVGHPKICACPVNYPDCFCAWGD